MAGLQIPEAVALRWGLDLTPAEPPVEMSTTPTFFGLHGVDGAQFDTQTVWREKESTGLLTIPIGRGSRGFTSRLGLHPVDKP